MSRRSILPILAVVLVVLAQPVYAVPSFSRAENLDCSACHTIYPQLNETGREYLEGGFSFASSMKLDDQTTIEGMLPVSARVNLRLMDKRTSKAKTTDALSDKDKQLKMRSFHELELFLAGKGGDKWAYFVEFESEDEFPAPDPTQASFGVQLRTGVVGYEVSENFDLHAGFGSPFYADPYNTVKYHKNVRAAWAPASFLTGNAQFVSASGRLAPKVFALVAWHGNDGLREGNDPKDFSGRIMFDASSTLSIGGFVDATKAYNGTTGKSEDKTTVYGADLQAVLGKANVNAIFGVVKDDVANTQETTWGIEGNVMGTMGNVQVGPILGVSSYTQNDGNDSFTMARAVLNVQMSGNIRTQFGWEGELSVPDPTDPAMTRFKESRLTWLVDLGI